MNKIEQFYKDAKGEELTQEQKKENRFTYYDMIGFASAYYSKQLIITDVVHWLPFVKSNYDKFTELAHKNKLLKKYDDGTILKDGDKEPLAIMTHFAEEI